MAAARVVRWRTEFGNTILDVLRARGPRGWVEARAGEPWDFFWCDKTYVREELPRTPLREGQRLNHFANYWELCRKDKLSSNLKKMRRRLEKEGRREEAEARMAFVPMTFNLPQEWPLFADDFRRRSQQQQQHATWWIAKPNGKSQGKGIFLFSTLREVVAWKSKEAEPIVVQLYVAQPYLVGGRKFDMRIYCLVTSYNAPGLVAYLHRAGFARLTHTRYSTSRASMANAMVHLTNVAVQKHSDGYDAESGCKWDLRALRLHMVRKHGVEAVDAAFLAVQQAIIDTLLAVQPVMAADRHHCCFELYGFDVLFDSELHPYVLEVNASPSMTAENPHDHLLKSVVLNDTFDVADIEGRRAPGEVVDSHGGFDLIHNCGWSRSTCSLGFYTPGLHGPPRATPAEAEAATAASSVVGDEEEEE